MYSSDLTSIKACRAIIGSCAIRGFDPVYASFSSNTTQSVGTVNPVAITYSQKDIGNIDIIGFYPSSKIRIPVSGVYRVLFSAQCDSAGGTHYLEIFPAVNGTAAPNSNTRIRLSAAIENCLTVEYILSFAAADQLELYMFGDSTNARILYNAGNPATVPAIPDTPSIIVTIVRIA
jgi:hypothetical protein